MFKKFFVNNASKIIPDKPVGFGYKNRWIAVKCSDEESVANFLGLKKVKESNWANGVEFGYRKGVFVTPQIDGWILALGVSLPDLSAYETQEFLKRASSEFGECQIFLTHRIVEYHAWGMARKGQIIRLYDFFGDTGENLTIEGEPTEIEKKYHLVNSFSEEAKDNEYWERSNLEFPDEETVMKIAASWSINPTKIGEMKNIEGIGLIGK